VDVLVDLFIRKTVSFVGRYIITAIFVGTKLQSLSDFSLKLSIDMLSVYWKV